MNSKQRLAFCLFHNLLFVIYCQTLFAQSARIVERDAEEESLLNAAAKILNKDIPVISSRQLLDEKEENQRHCRH